jgi:peptidase S41-like protein
LKTFAVPESEIKGMMKRAREAKAVVLDLRGNRGGLEDTMIELMNQVSFQPYEMGRNVTRDKSFPLRVKPELSRLGAHFFWQLISFGDLVYYGTEFAFSKFVRSF